MNIKLLSFTLSIYFQRERQMEENVLHWIEQVIHKRPDSDYESFIRDAVILSE